MAKGQLYQLVYRSDSGLDVILCSDLQWRSVGFNDGAHFTADEIEYLIDRWNQNGALNIDKIDIV